MTREPLPPEFSPRTIPALFADRVQASPDLVGLVARFQDGEYRSLTYRQWDDLTGRLAAALHRRFGVGKGSKVAWLLANRNGGEAMVAYHAVLRLGANNVPINARLAAGEIQYILRHSESALCIFPESLASRVLPALQGLSPRPAAVVVGEAPAGSVSWAELLESPGAALPAISLDPEDDADLTYTSGTTGRPKGVVHTHASSIACGIGWGDAFELQAEDVLQSPFPIFGGPALHLNTLCALWAGGTYVVDDFQAEQSLALMERCRTTVYIAVPSIYQFLLDSPAMESADLTAMRLLDFGGASMPPAVARRLHEALPQIRLMQTYGQTEGGALYLPATYSRRKPEAVGLRGIGRFTRFRVVAEDGRDVGPEEPGELLYRGPTIMKEYFKDPEATAQALAGGWLHSGDLVRFDRDGFVHHVDRKKDIIVRGGFNISSVEVEAALMEHPAVSEAAVVAKPHPKLGEDIRAYVVLRPGAAVTPPDLTAFCRERLADFKVPRDIVLRTELPHNASGKMLKHILRDEANQPPVS